MGYKNNIRILNILLSVCIISEISISFCLWLSTNNKIEQTYKSLINNSIVEFITPKNINMVYDQGNDIKDEKEEIYFTQLNENNIYVKNNLLNFNLVFNNENIQNFKENNLKFKFIFKLIFDEYFYNKYLNYNDALVENDKCENKYFNKNNAFYTFSLNDYNGLNFSLNFDHKIHYKKGMKPTNFNELEAFTNDVLKTPEIINFDYSIEIIK